MEDRTEVDPLALTALLAAIGDIRLNLDAIEKAARQLSGEAPKPTLTLTVAEWVRLHDRPKGNTESWTVRVLEKALGLRDQGYTCDEVRRIFGWKQNKMFVQFMQRFFDEFSCS